MKLLIVDDQPGVVRGLQQGIDWAAEGFSARWKRPSTRWKPARCSARARRT